MARISTKKSPPGDCSSAAGSKTTGGNRSAQDRTPADQTQGVKIEFTVFDKIGGPLTKVISLANDGTVISDGSACKMSKGTARRVTVGGVEEFAKIIGELQSHQGIALGALRDDLADEVKLVVKAKLNGKDGVIARTREHFVYREGQPALAPIDFDRNGMPDAVQVLVGDDVWVVLTKVLPALAGVARVMRRSTSTGLYNGDIFLPSSGGWHGYVLVLDGSDIERFLKTLHERCWLNGFGWFLITRAGVLSERSIIDLCMLPPEHLFFEGPPIVHPPLRQDVESRRPIVHEGEVLDTRVACPDLSAAEQETVAALKAAAREAIQPEADKVRAAYIDVRADEMVKRTGMPKADAMKVIESQCNGVLCAEVVLEFSHRKFKGCTVGDVLDEPERFAGATLADPIEGSGYKSGTTTAMVMLRRDNGYPWIKSFAHGGERSFTLVYKPGDELKFDFPGRVPDYAKKSAKQSAKQSAPKNEPENEPQVSGATPAVIAKWNKNHAHVLAGSKSCVLQEFKTADGFTDFKLLASAAFKEWIAEFKMVVKDKNGELIEIPESKYWLAHRNRRKYQDIGFFPNRDVQNFYNLWRGFTVEPRKGDCSKFLAHLHDNVCQDDDELYAWVIAWFADIFQRPGVKCGTSLAMRGKQGVGKTKVGEVFESLLGVHYKQVSDPRFVTGRFNSHMVSLLMLFADEGFWAGDKKAEGKLKDLVTGKKHPIEFKGKDAFWIDNYVRLLVSGNEDWVVPAGFEERRFATLDVGDAHQQDYDYFAAIDEEMNNGGREALLYHLLFEVDCSKVNLRQIPHTQALVDQKLQSVNPEQGWWLDILREGILPGDWEGKGLSPSKLLFDHYVEHAKAKGMPRRAIEVQLGLFINKMVGEENLERSKRTWLMPKSSNVNVVREQRRSLVFQFPTLALCRERFAEMFEEEMTWDEETDWTADGDVEDEQTDSNFKPGDGYLLLVQEFILSMFKQAGKYCLPVEEFWIGSEKRNIPLYALNEAAKALGIDTGHDDKRATHWVLPPTQR